MRGARQVVGGAVVLGLGQVRAAARMGRGAARVESSPLDCRDVIDLRSDTQTKPSPAMREAMASAEVGDEQEREDPTVLELERRGAELLGHEEAVYLPTATMGNQIALAILGERGTELIVEERAHIMVSELGGAAMHSGLQTRGLPGYRGRLSPEQMRATAWTEGDYWTPRTSIVALENTHNTAGGTVWPLDELREVVATARELGLRVHLDGARLLNAAVASGTPAAEIAGLPTRSRSASRRGSAARSAR